MDAFNVQTNSLTAHLNTDSTLFSDILKKLIEKKKSAEKTKNVFKIRQNHNKKIINEKITIIKKTS